MPSAWRLILAPSEMALKPATAPHARFARIVSAVNSRDARYIAKVFAKAEVLRYRIGIGQVIEFQRQFLRQLPTFEFTKVPCACHCGRHCTAVAAQNAVICCLLPSGDVVSAFSGTAQGGELCNISHVARRTSHVARRTSHVAPRTSHLAPSHLAPSHPRTFVPSHLRTLAPSHYPFSLSLLSFSRFCTSSGSAIVVPRFSKPFDFSVSMSIGRPAKRASWRMRRNGSSPRHPSPTCSWRSTRLPHGFLESFAWNTFSRSMPTIRSKAPKVSSCPAAVVMS